MLGLHKYGKVLFLTVLSINELWRNCLIWFLEGQCFQVWQAPYCFCGIYKCRKKMISLLTRVQSPYCPLRAMPYIFIFLGGGEGEGERMSQAICSVSFPTCLFCWSIHFAEFWWMLAYSNLWCMLICWAGRPTAHILHQRYFLLSFVSIVSSSVH